MIKSKPPITVPREWACFTSVSNTSLRKKAETAVKRAEATDDYIKTLNALSNFYKGWFRMCKRPKHQESGISDTAVREIVRGFGDDFLRHYVGMMSDELEYSIYEDAEMTVYRETK